MVFLYQIQSTWFWKFFDSSLWRCGICTSCAAISVFFLIYIPPSITAPLSSKYHINIFIYIPSLFKIPCHHLQISTPLSSKYHITLFKVPHHPRQSTTPPFTKKYRTTLFKVPHHTLHIITPSSSKYQTNLFKLPHHPIHITTPSSSNYHTTLFKVQHNRLQSTITTFFKVPHHPFQSTTPPSSNYHITLKFILSLSLNLRHFLFIAFRFLLGVVTTCVAFSVDHAIVLLMQCMVWTMLLFY